MMQRRYAFLIGANGPQTQAWRALRYAERDAQRLSEALKGNLCGFHTEATIAFRRDDTLRRLKLFTDKCEVDDLLVVHFSGHGMYDRELYLLCNDTDVNDLEASAMNIAAIKRYLGKCRARQKLLILDCCYSGAALETTFKSSGEAQIIDSLGLQGSASIILTACSRFERTRELDTLDEGAGFLSWVIINACSTRFAEVSSDGHSLSLSDIWKHIGTFHAEANRTLSEEVKRPLSPEERLPLPALRSELEGGVDSEIWFTPARKSSDGQSALENQTYNREQQLEIMIADHSSFINDRLNSFVGRTRELAKIQQDIADKLPTGGYVTITGQAGEGKSSIIAKLVSAYGAEQTACHFITFNPGPDHQVGLLRNLMARLIKKYRLPDIYIVGVSESRAVLRDFFIKVLQEIADRGGKEVIFIDGLDQLEEEWNGLRDLSFLPNNLPPGIVIVLGTRPNDTLRPLALLKPHHEYKLPNLSRDDFDLILEHRQVILEAALADRFYQAVQANALYLDLVAKELQSSLEDGDDTISDPTTFIKQLTDNPEQIFSLSMNRLKRASDEWYSIIKPILGLLLVVREPLGLRHIKQIIGEDEDRLKDGMKRLGGLVSEDWQRRYSLFHLKLYDFLRQDEDHPTEDFIFSTEEEKRWHKTIVQWCERGNLSIIWEHEPYDIAEQGRRNYARQHYITHLYRLGSLDESKAEWLHLFSVLNEGQYGRSKNRYLDPSMRAYALDLDLGRQAAAWDGWTLRDGIKQLPHLWRYSLLRCSLTSRADQYPVVAFHLLMLLKRKQEALDIAALQTKPEVKAEALLEIARLIEEPSEQLSIIFQACEVAEVVHDEQAQIYLAQKLAQVVARIAQRDYVEQIINALRQPHFLAETLEHLGLVYVQNQQWDQAETISKRVGNKQAKDKILSSQCGVLVQKACWEEALEIAEQIQDEYLHSQCLCEIGQYLIQKQQYDQHTKLLPLIKDNYWLTYSWLCLGKALAHTQKHLETEQAWSNAERLNTRVTFPIQRVRIWCYLAGAWQEIGQEKRAERALASAKKLIYDLKGGSQQAEARCELVRGMVRMRRWEAAKQTVLQIRLRKEKIKAWRILRMDLLQEKQWDVAENLIPEIQASEGKSEALYDLGATLAQSRCWTDARRIIEQLKGHGDYYAEAQYVLIRSLIEAGMGDLAKLQTKTIANRSVRVRALCEQGIKLALDGQERLANALWDEVESNILIYKGNEQTDILNETLRMTHEAQRQKSDGWHLSQTNDAIREETIWKVVEQWEHISESIASIYRQDVQDQLWGETCDALACTRLWSLAEYVAERMQDARQRAEALRKLGDHYIQTQQREKALDVWRQSQDLIQTIERGDLQSWALSELGASLLQGQQLEQTHQLVEQITDPHHRMKLLGKLGLAHFQAGRQAEAEELWATVENSIAILDDRRKVWDQCLFAKTLAQAQLWDRAERMIDTITQDDVRAGALSMLGEAFVQDQQPDQAETVWLEAADLISGVAKIDDHDNSARILARALMHAHLWDWAKDTINTMQRSDWQARVLVKMGEILYSAQCHEQADDIWQEAEEIIDLIEEQNEQIRALVELGGARARSQLWGEAEATWLKVVEIANTVQRAEQPDDSLEDVQQEQTFLFTSQEAVPKTKLPQQETTLRNPPASGTKNTYRGDDRNE